MCPNRKVLMGLDVVAAGMLTFDSCPFGRALPLPWPLAVCPPTPGAPGNRRVLTPGVAVER